MIKMCFALAVKLEAASYARAVLNATAVKLLTIVLVYLIGGINTIPW